MNEQQANQIVNGFGFQARAVRIGFYLAPFTRNRFGDRHVGDDQMYIDSLGDITPYADDAQAFLAATALSHAIKAAS